MSTENSAIRYIISATMQNGSTAFAHGCGLVGEPENAQMYTYNEAMSHLYSLRENIRQQEQREAQQVNIAFNPYAVNETNNVKTYNLVRVDMLFTNLEPPYESQIKKEIDITAGEE